MPASVAACCPAQAAQLLGEVLRTGDVLAISSGTTLAAIVDAMPLLHTSDITIVELEGAPDADISLPEYSTYELATRLAKLIHAQYRMIPVPREWGSREVADIIRADERIRRTLDPARHANVLFGVSSIDPIAPTLRHLAADILDPLKAAGAVGEIAARFFDAVGHPCPSRLDERLIGLALTELSHVPVRIGVTFGLHKVPAILGALRGGYLNVLVTDAQTAAALLAEVAEHEERAPEWHPRSLSAAPPDVAAGE